MILHLNIHYSYFQPNVGRGTPNVTVSLDCGSQQTFTCTVTGVAVWTISGLSGISVTSNSGQLIANNARITTNDTSGVVQSSIITITGFTIADNGGTIRCIDQANSSVQGMASISIGEWLVMKIHKYNAQA